MTGGLFDPLGADRPDHPARRPSAPAVALALLLAGFGALLLAAWLRDDGDRGRPTAVAPIERVEAPRPAPPAPPAPAPAAPAPAASAPPAPPAAEASGLPPVAADQDVEVQNGVRIVRPRRAAPAGQTIRVPPAP